MTDEEASTTKENAQALLLTALQGYIAAAQEMDLDDEEQRAELNDLLHEAGMSWEVRPG